MKEKVQIKVSERANVTEKEIKKRRKKSKVEKSCDERKLISAKRHQIKKKEIK